MGSICPFDVQFGNEIIALLKTPASRLAQEYFDNLIEKRKCRGIRVKVDGELGKGVSANDAFDEGELVFKDQMLLGSQHSINKMDCFVCSFCFRFIGSIEFQIGRRIYLQGYGVSANCHSDSSDAEGDCTLMDKSALGECSTSGSMGKTPLPKEIIESLMDGHLVLPYSEMFSLPSVFPCAGGCEEAFYCSKSCAESDWEMCHSLLCLGEKSKASSPRALYEFMEHANDTNDIFILAAKAISYAILRYKNLKEAYLKGGDEACNGSTIDMSLLLEAWKPISMGHKKRWWDCIALPEDVNKCDEATFRRQIKDVAYESLQLLKAAIFDEECAPLFSLEVYGHIIGMFELNNLDLVVASPVEDYFLYIDDLPEYQKKDAEAVTRPILDALGENYSICCQGTAFFPVQSCMNHSCCPNAKAFKRDEDKDGQATIIAVRHIQEGEEVTSYSLNNHRSSLLSW
uniref:[histone H3]-lysine(4) N-trimethyltransferase n=1 Tax=Opuntia streptacantha TaxID=393608 RepID=A0A7C9DXE1_OPUST